MTDLDTLFSASEGVLRLNQWLLDPQTTQLACNNYQEIFLAGSQGSTKIYEQVFASEHDYVSWIEEHLLPMTDAANVRLRDIRSHVLEASFLRSSGMFGSVHICLPEITGGSPIVTVRKQPLSTISLAEMVAGKMLDAAMAQSIQLLTSGRANILVSGGSGAGKTTMLRALAQFIDPSNRVITIEDTAELHVDSVLSNAVSLTTSVVRDPQTGVVLRRVDGAQLVEEALRMRADRIWVGEVRGGAETLGIVKAANSGHDGCATTIHSDSARQAVRQLVSYILETGMPEEAARDNVAQAFHIVIHIARISPTRRVITEIVELMPTREGGTEQRQSTLYAYDYQTDTWHAKEQPSERLARHLHRYTGS